MDVGPKWHAVVFPKLPGARDATPPQPGRRAKKPPGSESQKGVCGGVSEGSHPATRKESKMSLQQIAFFPSKGKTRFLVFDCSSTDTITQDIEIIFLVAQQTLQQK